MKVRLVKDNKTGRYWFEELLEEFNQWVKIESTDYACEGNARNQLKKEIERRRQQNLRVMRTYSETEEYEIFS